MIDSRVLSLPMQATRLAQFEGRFSWSVALKFRHPGKSASESSLKQWNGRERTSHTLCGLLPSSAYRCWSLAASDCLVLYRTCSSQPHRRLLLQVRGRLPEGSALCHWASLSQSWPWDYPKPTHSRPYLSKAWDWRACFRTATFLALLFVAPISCIPAP